ncbi:helix-turn-helix transcriptional regulator [Haloarchaeobius amylolyticus]|uniref:helix-turn-helix transcriptional regulator n=1 Tax=Haloarchaeobius amylolyticus TaxID=1198296 RepID=UPI00226EED13|nr:transcriptional regulator FilR1 domain-containing protein [Haloarchaeobius amylolyticus]
MAILDTVYTSSVRQAVLRTLRDDPQTRRHILDEVDASKSAVYNALNELRDRRLVAERDDRVWETTGLGDLVADQVDDRERTARVLDDHGDYFASHDAAALPRWFRQSLGALAGCEHLTAPSSDPYRVVRRTATVIEEAESLDVLTPIYHDRYADAIRSVTDRTQIRLGLDASILSEVESQEADDWDHENPTVRIHDHDFALTVTHDAVMLSLPREDGSYDAQTKLVARSDAALAWGRRLFESCWGAATPIGEFAPHLREDDGAEGAPQAVSDTSG